MPDFSRTLSNDSEISRTFQKANSTQDNFSFSHWAAFYSNCSRKIQKVLEHSIGTNGVSIISDCSRKLNNHLSCSIPL